ncbi:hypothetical protein [Ferviditalea candida]|uniref:Uncharacterized protein n=1 Tax=Ferviditalea candida TaxID=3108399 RepID=A0ABU5ZEG3_9BACL|nr:hypothetical protein [Paenibacillaceae bacterium T2]
MKKKNNSEVDYSVSAGRKITLDVFSVAKQMGIPQQDIRGLFMDIQEKNRVSGQAESK